MRILTCPQCGASSKIETENRDFVFCQFCGTKILLDDVRITHRIVDEAEIKQAEALENIRLKELELQEKEMLLRAQTRKTKIIATCILVPLGFYLTIHFGSYNNDAEAFAFLFGIFSLISIPIIWKRKK